MILRQEIASDYGSILFAIFSTAADGLENTPQYDVIEEMFLQNVAQIYEFGKDGINSHLFNVLINGQITVFNLCLNTRSIDDIIDSVISNARFNEIIWCKDNLYNYLWELTLKCNIPNFVLRLTKITDKFLSAANQINIKLDSSVSALSRVAAMHLSGTIINGINLSLNSSDITICKNKITFGHCNNPFLQQISGNVSEPYYPGPNFYLEFGNLVYYYDNAFKCSFWNRTLSYQGFCPPTEPDNITIFNIIYPKFS